MKALAIPYIISYILIVYLVVANMFIAVILENYEEVILFYLYIDITSLFLRERKFKKKVYHV